MKLFLLFYAFTMICILPVESQSFSNVVLRNAQDRKVVCFTLPHETNVRYYRIEAGNDSNSYQIIGTIRSTGNSILAKSYRYELHEPVYKYYRVSMVGMDASLVYSPVITTQKQEEHIMNGQNTMEGSTIVNNK